jgi:hypothetical protein
MEEPYAVFYLLIYLLVDLYFEAEACYVVQAGFELMILLSWLPEY